MPGEEDPAVRSEAAEVVERVVSLAEVEGLETLADLWSGSPADSLAGCLWRLYLLRSWVYADAASAAPGVRSAHGGIRQIQRDVDRRLVAGRRP